MSKTFYLGVLGTLDPENPIRRAVRQVLSAVTGATIATRLIDEHGREVDIAVTDSLVDAHYILGQTKKTNIIFSYMHSRDRETAEMLAAKFPGRVQVTSYFLGEPNGPNQRLVPLLCDLAR